jgi:D-xylose transport system substrate-binding protein
MVREGQMKVLRPLVERGDVRIVADQWAKGWQAIEALKITENALTRTGNLVDAVVASNDGTAGGAIQALAEQKLSGRVLVSGQDADLVACRRVVAGTQTMTVYKPIRALARVAAETAVRLARKRPLDAGLRTVNNGRKDVASILLEPVAVDRDNMVATVVADGFHTLEAVYRDVPRAEWPAPPQPTKP